MYSCFQHPKLKATFRIHRMNCIFFVCFALHDVLINPSPICVNGSPTDTESNILEESDIGTRLIYEGVHPGEAADVAVFVESRKGKTVLQYKGHRYRRAYKSRRGTRWNCSLKKSCSAFVYINDSDEIIMSNEEHEHPQCFGDINSVAADDNDTAVVITSRKGREMLLFRQYTYRKQYDTGTKSRWICTTLKNCRGAVFTDNNNFITSSFEEHCHPPPKYYLKPDHVISALREPLIFETD